MRTVSPRTSIRLVLAAAVGGLLILGPSAALAQAPAAPMAPANSTHGVAGMTGHVCPSMNNDLL